MSEDMIVDILHLPRVYPYRTYTHMHDKSSYD